MSSNIPFETLKEHHIDALTVGLEHRDPDPLEEVFDHLVSENVSQALVIEWCQAVAAELDLIWDEVEPFILAIWTTEVFVREQELESRSRLHQKIGQWLEEEIQRLAPLVKEGQLTPNRAAFIISVHFNHVDGLPEEVSIMEKAEKAFLALMGDSSQKE